MISVDSFIKWKRVILQLKKIEDKNPYAHTLKLKLDERLNMIVNENDALLCSLFIDPRFNFKGKIFFTAELKEKAEVRIFKIYHNRLLKDKF